MGHTYANLLVHVIFGTKDRQPSIQDDFRERLHEYLGGIVNGEAGRSLCVGGTMDHVHALIVLKTDVTLAHALNRMKSLSSGWVKHTFPTAADFAWQTGYGAFSVSESNVDRVVGYIKRQAEHHQTRTFAEEFTEFLTRHRVPYDPMKLWE